MKNLLRGFVLLLFALSSASLHAAVAANDVILTQRNSGNTTNIQSPVTATANAVLMFNDTLVPVSKTLVAGDNITITQNAGNITINSTGGGGSGNVTGSSLTANAVAVGAGTNSISVLASLGTSGQPLISAGAGAPPSWGTLGVAGGGTGLATITANNIITGNGTGALNLIAPGTSGNVLTSNGTAWTSATPSAGGNVTNNASLTANVIVLGNGTTGIGPGTITYCSTNATYTTAGNITANVISANNITVTDMTTTNLTISGAITGVMPLANGGTGFSSTTAGNIIVGNNTTTYGQLGVGANGTVLTSNTSAPLKVSWEALAAGGNVTGASLTANAIVIGNGTTSIKIGPSPGTSGNVLKSDGTNWVSGTVPGGGGGDIVATLVNSEVSITAATTLTSGAFGNMHVCSGTSADYTVDLPAASGNAGKIIGIRMAGGLTKLVTLDGNASETIDGATTKVMWANESVVLICDGSNWNSIASKSVAMRARMYAGSTASIANNAETKVVTDTITTNVPSGQCNTGSSRIDIKRTGNYSVTAGTTYINLSSNGNMIQQIRVNGSLVSFGNYYNINGSYPTNVYTETIRLTAGDYVENYTAQYSGFSQNIDNSNTGAFVSIVEIP